MGRGDTKEGLHSEGNKKSQRGCSREREGEGEKRKLRSVQGLRVMLRISRGMVLSGRIMAVMRKIESGKGQVCVKRPPGQCHRGADETG